MMMDKQQPKNVTRSKAKGIADEKVTTILGVQYTHIRMKEGDDLYVTQHGLPFRQQLLPENVIKDREWFEANSQKLFGSHMRSGGTGTLYRIRTKPVDGRSLDIVLKWNRMAQDIPGHRDAEEFLNAEFNSPFEEFALMMEMRGAAGIPGQRRIHTHKPLAIYVPSSPVDPERLGRKEYKMREKMRNHTEIDLDLRRRYAVIYEWVKGIDLCEACHRGFVTETAMGEFTLAVDEALGDIGYLVRDRKPQHIIVRPEGRFFKARRDGDPPPHALIDFELLERTPAREREIRASRRHDYLVRQVHRFQVLTPEHFPEHLQLVAALGVDYVCGRAESTGGILWVTGNDPALYDYFLPERWEPTPRMRLSAVDEVYETVSKDNIHLVWKISRVGRVPEMDPFRPRENEVIKHGNNSPFEEVAIALELDRAGVPTIFPRAIYMTNHPCEMVMHLQDPSRYESHRDLMFRDGRQFLRSDREYVTIWGYWNRSDADLASKDEDYYEPVDALRALREGLIDEQIYFSLMRKTQERLADIGIEDLAFGGRHKLLSIDATGSVVLDTDGLPLVRICNVELMRHVRRH